MSSVNNKYNTSTTAPEVVNMYGAPTNVLKGSIVICVHGLFGSATQLNSLFDNLKTSAYKDYFDAVILDGSVYAEMIEADRTKLSKEDDIKQKDATDRLLNDLKTYVGNNPNKNYFFKVELKSPWAGLLNTQVDSLHKVVSYVRRFNLPIVLLGYSKGGVVNMRYVKEYGEKSPISKLISIATPHTETFLQEAIRIIFDKLKDDVPNMILYADEVVKLAYSIVEEKLVNKIDLLPNWWITDKTLMDKWNSVESKPKVTTIRGDAINVREHFISDFVVPDNSADALGFEGITRRYRIKDEMATLSFAELKERLGSGKEWFNYLKNVAEKIVSSEDVKVVEAFYELLTKYMEKIRIDEYVECMKLAHTDLLDLGYCLLDHKSTAKYVYFGLYA